MLDLDILELWEIVVEFKEGCFLLEKRSLAISKNLLSDTAI